MHCVVVVLLLGCVVGLSVDEKFVFSHGGGRLTMFNGATKVDYDLDKKRLKRAHLEFRSEVRF
jgi:hypothetical protein